MAWYEATTSGCEKTGCAKSIMPEGLLATLPQSSAQMVAAARCQNRTIVSGGGPRQGRP